MSETEPLPQFLPSDVNSAAYRELFEKNQEIVERIVKQLKIQEAVWKMRNERFLQFTKFANCAPPEGWDKKYFKRLNAISDDIDGLIHDFITKIERNGEIYRVTVPYNAYIKAKHAIIATCLEYIKCQSA